MIELEGYAGPLDLLLALVILVYCLAPQALNRRLKAWDCWRFY